MSKSRLTALITVILIVGVALFLYEYDKGAIPSLSTSSVSSVFQVPPIKGEGAALPDVVKALSKEVFAVSYLTPANFAQPVQAITEYVKKVKSSGLWVKFDLEKLMSTSLDQAEALQGLPAGTAANSTQNLKTVGDVWGALDSLVLALKKPDSNQAKEVLPLPGVLLTAAFHDPAPVDQAKRFLKALTASGPWANPDQTIAIAKEPSEDDVYRFILKLDGGTSLRGKIEPVGPKLSLSLNAPSAKSFYGSETGSFLSEQPQWKEMVKNILPNSASFIFVDSTQLASVATQLLQVVGPASGQDAESFKTLLAQALNQSEALAGGMAFDHGLNSVSCVRYADGSDKTKELANWASEKSKNKQPANLFRAISPRTLLATRWTKAAIISAFSSFQAKDLQASAKNAGSDEWKRFADLYSKLMTKFEKIQVEEIGLVVNTPLGSLTPNVAMLIGHNGSLTVTGLKDAMNDIAKDLKKDAGLLEVPDAEIVKASDLSDMLQLTIGEGKQLVGGAVSSTAIALTLEPGFLDELKQSFSAKSPLLSAQLLESKGFRKNIDASEGAFFLSTTSTLSIARQFAPLLLMQAPDKKVTDSEIEEALSFLDFNFLSVQDASLADKQTMCAQSRSVVF